MSRSHSQFNPRWIAWIALVLLVAAHLCGIFFIRRKSVTAEVAGIVFLLVVTHVGVLAPVYALFRRWAGK